MRFDRGTSQSTVVPTGIDVAATHQVADRLGAAADLIDGAVRDHLATLSFSGAGAGREHAARGDALRAQLDRLAGDLTRWSTANVGLADALRVSADRYVDAEMYAAARIA